MSRNRATKNSAALPAPLTLRRSHLIAEKVWAVAAAFNNTASLVAVAYRDAVQSRFANKVLVWNFATWRAVKTFRGCTDSVDDLAFAADGATLYCAGSTKSHFMGGELQAWNVRSKKSQTLVVGENIWSFRRVAVSPDRQQIATGAAVHTQHAENKVHLWNSAGKRIGEFAKFVPDVQGLQFSPDGKSLAVGVPSDRTASVWSMPDGRKRWLQRAHSQASHLRVEFSPNGELLATCGDKVVALWNAKTGKRRALLKGHADNVRSLAFSPDGGLLFTSASNDLCVWEVATGKLLAEQKLPAHCSFLKLHLSPDGRTLTGVHSINAEVAIHQYDVADITSGELSTPIEQAPPQAAKLWARETSLRAAAIAKPDDNAPRLRYAQWLEDRGDPRGEFIRVQCELHELDTTTNPNAAQKKRQQQLRLRETQLLEAHHATWTAPLAELQLQPGSAKFQRGLLWQLELCDVGIDDDALRCLQHAPEIEHLSLDGSSVSDAGMRHVKAVTNLVSLNVSETAVTVKSLATLKSLQRLVRVYNYEWGNERVPELERWKGTRNARFRALPTKRKRVAALQALGAGRIVDWLRADDDGRYSAISFSQSWATDADLAYLPVIDEVESLDFFECRAVTSAGLKHLWPLKRLRVLRLSESGVTDLAPLAKLTHLEELDISSLEELDPHSFRHLAKLPRLQRLTMRFCRLGDEVLPHIARCKELRELYTDYNEFTDDGLRHLVKLQHLEKFEVDYEKDRRALLAEILH